MSQAGEQEAPASKQTEVLEEGTTSLLHEDSLFGRVSMSVPPSPGLASPSLSSPAHATATTNRAQREALIAASAANFAGNGESVAHELANVFNRLRSTDVVFMNPIVDDYSSSHTQTRYTVDAMLLSLSNGKLLRQFFDPPPGQPQQKLTTRRWVVQEQLLQSILNGNFDISMVIKLFSMVRDLRGDE